MGAEPASLCQFTPAVALFPQLANVLINGDRRNGEPGQGLTHHLRSRLELRVYHGIGAGAHSKLSFPHRIVRQVRFRQPASYLQNARQGRFVAESVEVGRADLPFEFMLNALRLSDGFEPTLFTERTGLALSSIERALGLAESRGLIVRDHRRIVPTPLGRRFLSDLQGLFLPQPPAAG